MKLRVLPFALSLIVVGVARAAFNPIPLTPESFNQDVVVESNATPRLVVVTTASVDQGTNNGANTWMEIGFDPANPTFGLPAPGTVVTAQFNANYTFQMPPSYTAPNGILINATQVTNGTFTLVAPAPYAMLSFAGSGGNGGDVIGVKVHHQDGSIEGSAFPCPDWFNGTSNVIFVANERCGSTVNFTYANINSGNPRIYARDMVLTNTTSPVTSIDLYYVSGPAGSHNDVLAVSGATSLAGPVTPIAVTGYTYDFIVEASAAKRGLVMAANGIDRATSQSMDNAGNTANSWYEIGYNLNNPDGGGVPIPDPTMRTNSGIPVAGSTVTNAAGDHIYQMPPSYSSSNALWLDPTVGTTGTITPVAPFSVAPTAPATAAALSFLAAAGGGQQTPEVVLNFQDGTSQTSNIVVPDWFNTAAPFVHGANGRVAVDTAQFNSITRTANRTPRLFNCDLIVGNTTSAITNILVNYTNTGGRLAIFAVSGATDPIKPVFTASPPSTAVNPGANVQLAGTAIANAAITYRWQKGTNGVYVDLTDGGNISGATTTTLSINNVTDADDGDYRLVATDNAGSANSGVAFLTVISALPDVTQPGDPIVAYQPNGGSSPAAETVDHAIDNVTQKYLNNGNGASPLSIPVGFTVTPNMGRTRVTGMRLYTANDAPERDPANVILEGSDDGGNTWTLIYSNIVVMPDGRNGGGGIALDPLTQNIRQIRFTNNNGYTRYRWYTTRVRGATALMQIGEVELLGVTDTSGLPTVSVPAEVKAFQGSSAMLNATVTGTPAPTLQWQKEAGGVFSNLSDGGTVSGATTATLTLNPASFSDAANYRVIASNSSGSRTSSVVNLVILSSLTDVTQPGDPIGATGGEGSTVGNGIPDSAIDNTPSTPWQSGGSGINASAGFPPFGGPVVLSNAPAVGATLVTALRIYTATDAPERDPADYKLEGSNDGGATYSLISQGTLALPAARTDNAQAFDPLIQPLQEIRFANNRVFTSYRITFTHTKNDNAASQLQIGELELLGVTGAANPTVSIETGSGGTITITSSANGTLQSRTNLVTGQWVDEGPITAGTPRVITPSPTEPAKFYRVQVP